MPTYADLTKAIIGDFESFFLSKKRVTFEYQFTNVMSPKVVGVKILIPDDIEGQDVLGDEEAIFYLLVISHEIAHVMHKHANYEDDDHVDSIGIELWADYYGMRVAMSILNFRSRFRSILVEKHDGDSLIVLIGHALVRLCDTYYDNQSDKYPSVSFRARTSMTGITSFFARLDGFPLVSRFVDVVKRVYTDAGLSRYFGFEPIGDYEDMVIQRIRTIHLQIVGNSKSITHGVQPRYQKFIGTNFE